MDSEAQSQKADLVEEMIPKINHGGPQDAEIHRILDTRRNRDDDSQ